MLRYWWCSFSTGAVVLRVFDIHIRQISSEVNLYTSAAVWCDNKDIVVRHAFSTRAIWVKRVRNIFVYRVVCRSSPETTWAVCTWYSAEFALLSYFHCSQTTSCDAGKEIVSNIPEQTHVCVCVLCVCFVSCLSCVLHSIFHFAFYHHQHVCWTSYGCESEESTNLVVCIYMTNSCCARGISILQECVLCVIYEKITKYKYVVCTCTMHIVHRAVGCSASKKISSHSIAVYSFWQSDYNLYYNRTITGNTKKKKLTDLCIQWME